MKQIIIHDTKILGGKPIIAGTRMSVESILELLGAGLEIQNILTEYPILTREQIQAAIRFTSDMLRKEERYDFTRKSAVHEISH